MGRHGKNGGMIAFSWDGLPQYAARLIRAAINKIDEECVVIGSKPNVPVNGMEEVLGQRVHWVDPYTQASWEDIGLSVPEIYFQSGWGFPAFSALGVQVRASGGRVVGLTDANWRGDFRQLVLGPIAFRVLHRGHFDAMIVAGKQGTRLMRYLGMRPDQIRIGVYGADPGLFNGGLALAERPKTILYVGQFIARKNVLGLASAFLKFAEKHPEWTLHMCGSGEQLSLIPKHSQITVENFVQPEQLVERYRSARFFVLPSLVEAWGLVVHEAALCGCGLILSDAIGSADDLAGLENAERFRAGSKRDLERALNQVADYDDQQLKASETESRALSNQFGPNRFANEVVKLVNELRNV